MRKFAYFVIATSLALALALAGCGGSGTGTSTSTGTGTNGGVTLGVLNGVATSFTASCFDGTTQTSTVSDADARGKCAGHGGTDTIDMPWYDPVAQRFITYPTKIVPIVTDTQTSTYAAQGLTEEAAAFELLNQERARCGFGTLRQNAALDKAAKAHADWQNLNGYYGHLEDSKKPNGFTGVAPWDRIIAAGYGTVGDLTDEIAGARSFFEEISKIGFGTQGMRGLLNAPYHMRGLLAGYRDVGISVRTSEEVGTDFGQLILQINPAYLHTNPRQELSNQDVSTYPCQGTTGTDYQLDGEIPNPVPGRDLRTNPLGGTVFVQLRYGNKLVFTSATMTQVSGDGAGTAVTLRDPVTSANSGNAFQSHQGYIVADAPLEPNTQYEVVINGTNNGTPFTRQFTFTTGTGG